MPELDLLITAAREAGEIALRYADAPLRSWEKPDGAGPVTEADLAVNAALEARLRGARPEYGWLSEESAPDTARLSTQRQFIIDPIDGTRAFAAGDPIWAHALAICEDGHPIAAVVYLPKRDEMFTAARGHGAQLNGQPITVSAQASVTDATVLAPRPMLDPEKWPGGLPTIKRAFRPALAYRLAAVAEGRFDAMLTLRPAWEWDIAAGVLLVAEAGGRVTTSAGGPLRFNSPEAKQPGVVAANPAVHGGLIAGLTPPRHEPPADAPSGVA